MFSRIRTFCHDVTSRRVTRKKQSAFYISGDITVESSTTAIDGHGHYLLLKQTRQQMYVISTPVAATILAEMKMINDAITSRHEVKMLQKR